MKGLKGLKRYFVSNGGGGTLRLGWSSIYCSQGELGILGLWQAHGLCSSTEFCELCASWMMLKNCGEQQYAFYYLKDWMVLEGSLIWSHGCVYTKWQDKYLRRVNDYAWPVVSKKWSKNLKGKYKNEFLQGLR